MNEISSESDVQDLGYLIAHLNDIPEAKVEEALRVLLGSGEVEYAVVLCRNHQMIDRAIDILVEAGDYLWAAQIARQSGREKTAQELLEVGLEYYISMNMYGRALSAARVLKLPPAQIDHLFREGIAYESQNMDLGRSQAALESLMTSLSSLDLQDETSRELREAIRRELARQRGGLGEYEEEELTK